MAQSKQMSLPSLFYNFGYRNIIFFGILGESVKCKVGKNAILALSRAEMVRDTCFQSNIVSITYDLIYFFLFDFNIAKMHFFCSVLKDYCCFRPKMTFPVLISDYECHCGYHGITSVTIASKCLPLFCQSYHSTMLPMTLVKYW